MNSTRQLRHKGCQRRLNAGPGAASKAHLQSVAPSLVVRWRESERCQKGVPAIVEFRLGIRPFRSEDRPHGAHTPSAVSRRGLPRELMDQLPDWTSRILQR